MTTEPTTDSPGSPDPGFGADGVVSFPIPGLAAGMVFGAVSTEDEQLLFTAMARVPGKPDKLAKLHRNGALDVSFGNNGSVDLPFDPALGLRPSRLHRESDGSLLITGSNGQLVMVMKLDANGVPIPGFGPNGDGTTVLDINELVPNNPRLKNPRFMNGRHDGQSQQSAQAGDVGAVGIAARDGRIFLVDTVYFQFNHLRGIVVCLTKDGLLDLTFNGTGAKLVELPNINELWNYAMGLAVQPDGRLLVCGYLSVPGDAELFPAAYMLRLTAEGEIDPSYGQGQNKNGVVILAEHEQMLELRSLVIKPDGGAFAVGLAGRRGQGRRGFVVSLKSSGEYDSNFGGGSVYSSFLSKGVYWARCALQEDGKLVVGGQGGPNVYGDESSTVVARYLRDGSLDLLFNEKGWVERNAPNGFDDFRDMIVTPEGRVAVAGGLQTPTTPIPGFVACYLG